MNAYQHLDVREVDDVAVVRFRDRTLIEDANIQELGQELQQLVKQDNCRKLILNFTAVDFLASAALGKLITLDKLLRATNGKMKLCCIRPELLDTIKISRLDRVFDITKDEEEAITTW